MDKWVSIGCVSRYCYLAKKRKRDKYSNMDESQKLDAEQKKLNTKDYTWYDSIYMKF